MTLIKIVLYFLSTAVEALFWTVHGVASALRLTGAVARSAARLSDGTLRCPRGHIVPTEGETYECASCGYRYEGSVWLCPNPECEAPVSSYCTCPTCGLSVPSP